MGRGKRKADKPQVAPVKFKASDLLEAINETVRLQKQQSEYGGFAGRHKQGFCKKHGYDQTAFAWLTTLTKLDDHLKALSLVEQFLLGVEVLGIVKQGDLFSETSKIANRIRDRMAVEDEPETPTGDEALQTFQRRLDENADKAPTPAEVDAAAETRASKRRRGKVERQDLPGEIPEYLDRRQKRVQVHDGGPTEAMRASTAAGDAHIKAQIAASLGNDITGIDAPVPA